MCIRDSLGTLPRHQKYCKTEGIWRFSLSPRQAFWRPLWVDFGAILAPKRGPCWGPKTSWTCPRAKKTTPKNTPKTMPKTHKKQKPVNAWNGKRACIVDPEGDLRTCVCTCLYEFVYTAMLKIKQNYTQISIKIQPKIITKFVKHRPKNRSNICQNQLKIKCKTERNYIQNVMAAIFLPPTVY